MLTTITGNLFFHETSLIQSVREISTHSAKVSLFLVMMQLDMEYRVVEQGKKEMTQQEIEEETKNHQSIQKEMEEEGELSFFRYKSDGASFLSSSCQTCSRVFD